MQHPSPASMSIVAAYPFHFYITTTVFAMRVAQCVPILQRADDLETTPARPTGCKRIRLSKLEETPMKKLSVLLLIGLFFGGCATSPIPENYSGPLASVRDTALSETSSRAQFYFLSEIDGRKIKNGLTATRIANSGRGFQLSPVSFARDIPATTATFILEGRIGYGAPIQEIVNSSTIYTVEKKISFKPESNKRYVVKGTLTAERKDVWIEDEETGKRIE